MRARTGLRAGYCGLPGGGLEHLARRNAPDADE